MKTDLTVTISRPDGDLLFSLLIPAKSDGFDHKFIEAPADDDIDELISGLDAALREMRGLKILRDAPELQE